MLSLRRRPRWSLAGALIPVFVLTMVWSVACGGHGKKKRFGKRKARAFTVQVERVSERTLSDDILATGTTRPIREMSLTTQVQGAVTKLEVRLGRKVKKGEVLARVSTVGLWGESRQVYAELKRLKSDIKQAKQERKDTNRLFRQKLISRKQFDDARYSLLRLQAQYAQAQARLSAVGERFRGGVVRAPFGGVIASQGVDLGDYVTPGKVIGHLVDLSAVKVRVGLAEVDVVRISTKTQVTVEFPSLKNVRVPGHILAISPVADAQTGAFDVEIRVENKARKLRGGMAVRAIFKRPGIHGIFVPVEAVVRRSGRDVAYVLNAAEDKVSLRKVKVGLRRDGYAKIQSGLRLGERVVVSGNTRLRDGSRVRLVGSMSRGKGRASRGSSQASAGMDSGAGTSRPHSAAQ